MGEFLVIIDNTDGEKNINEDQLETVKEIVFPDNAPVQTVERVIDDELQFFVFNPRGVTRGNGAACFGDVLRGDENWTIPGTGKPDGSYSLIRNDDQYTEVLTDAVASRTVWYLFTEDYAIISSRQRPIVYLKGSFVPNEEASAWMICSGHLGPYNSWDREISMLPPDSVLRLNRKQWELDVERTWPDFSPSTTNRDEVMEGLDQTLSYTFKRFDFNSDSDVLTLSGGYDSRTTTHYLSKQHELRTVTWGHSDALADPTNDAAIANSLAGFYETNHTYLELGLGEITENPEKVLERFVLSGEGRIDHLAAYVDGFGIFEHLAGEGVRRMIRSDHAFGVSSASPTTIFTPARHLRWLNNIILPGDCPSIPINRTGLLPPELQQDQYDSLSKWRDHLRQSVNIPIVLSALSSIKTPYLEVSNPLLTRKLVKQGRSIPTELRAEKQLYKDLVLSLNSEVPIAENSALTSMETVLRIPSVVNYLSDSLEDRNLETVDTYIIEYALANLSEQPQQFNSNRGLNMRSLVREHLPHYIVDILRHYLKKSQEIDPNRLAFRLYIISKIEACLFEDAMRN